jgi:hypothetical protein
MEDAMADRRVTFDRVLTFFNRYRKRRKLPGCRRQLGVALADASAFRRITSI